MIEVPSTKQLKYLLRKMIEVLSTKNHIVFSNVAARLVINNSFHYLTKRVGHCCVMDNLLQRELPSDIEGERWIPPKNEFEPDLQ